MRTRIPIYVVLALIAMLIAALPTFAVTEHCPGEPGGNGDRKVNATEETQDEINDLVLPEGTLFCVKSSTEATGLLTADGETTLQEYLFEAGIVDGSGEQGRDVSYYVTYEPEESEPAESLPAESEPAESQPAESEPAESEPAASVPAESVPASAPAESQPLTGGGTPPGDVPDTAVPSPASGIVTIVLALIMILSVGVLARRAIAFRRAR